MNHFWHLTRKEFIAGKGHSVTKLLFVELKFPQVCCRNESQNSIAVDLLHSRDKERKKESEVAPSCLTLWDPMDYTVHGIL